MFLISMLWSKFLENPLKLKLEKVVQKSTYSLLGVVCVHVVYSVFLYKQQKYVERKLRIYGWTLGGLDIFGKQLWVFHELLVHIGQRYLVFGVYLLNQRWIQVLYHDTNNQGL